MILDGEGYSSPDDSFQTIMSYVKKYQKGLTEKVKFYIYDVVTNMSFTSRYANIVAVIPKETEHVEIVEPFRIKSEYDLKEFHTHAISLGYEGSMVRWGDDGYKVNGRSSNLLKYKDFHDMVAEIIDIIPSEQRPTWGTPVFNGFKAGVKMTHEQREDLLTNKEDYIGKMAEVRYFEMTDDGSVRFPIMIGIRLDK